MWKLKCADDSEGAWLLSLNQHVGRQTWHYDPEAGTPSDRLAVEKARQDFANSRFSRKHSADLLMRIQYAKENPSPSIPPRVQIDQHTEVTEDDILTTLRRAVRFYSTIQADDGHWPNDYGGPLFILPGMVIVLYTTGSLNVIFSEAHKEEICRYLFNHQNKDGGWGLHIEGHSTMIGSVLSYVTLRLLGQNVDGGEDQAMEKARSWILKHGSATAIASWGKFWLSVLGVYEWAGNNPVPPEAWLLPYFLPVHPGRMWCHCRMVYLPMSYIYGKRFVGKITGVVLSLRKELYSIPYNNIDWNKARNDCAKEDLFYPHPLIQDFLWATLDKIMEPVLMHWPGSLLRKKALATVMEHVHYEDETTRYVCIGCVNKVVNMLCCWVENPNSNAFKFHLPRLKDYLWLAEDGMKMQSYNGSQLWDTAFAVQALLSTELLDECASSLKKAHYFIDRTQVRDDFPGDLNHWYRHISKGGWPFSTQDHGWPVTDCTAEGLKAALALSLLPSEIVGDPISSERIYDAVNVMLSYQNANGGIASYELTRAYHWLEMINPSEIFADVVIDHQYVECTSAVIQALAAVKKLYPKHRAEEVTSCIYRASRYIESIQLKDGSWYGSWGICYTYGTWFGVLGLIAAGHSYENSTAIQKACDFLLSKQLPSGGWGESYLSSQNQVYTNLEGGRCHTVHTSWAMLGLIYSGQALRNPEPLHKAASVLVNSQLDNGDFPQEEITGVTNKNCMISYSAYRNVFPIWALGEYRRRVLNCKM